MIDGVSFGQNTHLRSTTRRSLRALSLIQSIAASADENISSLVEFSNQNPALALSFQLDDFTSSRRRGFPLSGASQRALDLVTPELSLVQHVASQIPWLVRNNLHQYIAYAWLETLEPTGWTSGTPEELALEHKCTPDLAEDVLTQLQAAEPSGLFARTLAECLGLQLKAQNNLTSSMIALLSNLPLLAEGELGKLKEACGVSQAVLSKMIADLRRLNPKPGTGFGDGPIALPSPDMLLSRDENGAWHLDRNSYLRPNLSLLRLPDKQLTAQAASRIRASDMRDDLIFGVARRVIELQIPFLCGNNPFPIPLTAASLADEMGIHETTVGRIRKHLSIGTDNERFHLSALFFQGIHAGPLGHITPFELGSRITEIVTSSESRMSDRAVTDHLAATEIFVSRRTVAKYRRQSKAS